MKIQIAIEYIGIDIVKIQTENPVTNRHIQIGKVAQSEDVIQIQTNRRQIPTVQFAEAAFETQRRPVPFFHIDN